MDTSKEQAETKTVMATFEVKVPVEDWIDYITRHTDIFLRQYCGYWMLGVKLDDDRGWLVFEDPDGEYANKKEPGHDAAVRAWKIDGTALPARWHRLDKAMAIKAYIEGVKLWGLGWFEKADANDYDRAIQLAMLGEVRYS